jgi:hypothetical protein
MHQANSELDAEAFVVAAKLSRIACDATQKAVEENRRLGVPSAYSINGRIYYELPNGELSLEDPGVSAPLSGTQSNGRTGSGASPTN